MCIYRQVSSNDYSVVESRVKQIVKEKQPFERLVMTKENLLKMFEVKFILQICSFSSCGLKPSVVVCSF